MIAYNTNDYAVRYAEFYKKESYRLTNDAQNIEEIEQDIIKLEKHPIYYLTELLDLIYRKFLS